MANDFREKQQKSYTLMRRVYDFAMALLILGMAVVMLFAEQLRIEQLSGIDNMFRYLFGGICVLYGGFRLYRGFKSDY
ncbi:hypothetical protein [Sediminibacterium ginsengisoli]|uniref:Uncharacterized protein n=1 Tax=Sediminibacterium ginsengisoli TaxID=413434 RepID=A0A1T4NAA5_9BACT|nr:hypothetical protein [Sediminibacterium ginsengisoli]SJZ76174.1 hypothetical protein SAMN04488132_104172 [Sediminibacterium ginsengisoli]